MGTIQDEDCLIQDNIQEFVHDENKIVTCKWLSLTLSLPVNSAKQALFEFVDCARKHGNNDDINVTYFVSGFETNECSTKILKCIVVPECHLESTKQSLDPVTSCHIYSVQKAKLKDYTPLYQADYDICKENVQALSKFSSISCPWAVQREGHSASKPNKDSAVSDKTADKVIKEEKPSPASSAATSTSSSSSSNTSSNNTTKKTTNKKGGIASMFAAAGNKGEKKVEKNVPEKKEATATTAKAKETSEKKKGGGIQAFMKAGAGKAAKDKAETSLKKTEEAAESEVQSKKKTAVDCKPEKSQKHKLSEKDEPKRKRRRRIRDDLFDSSDEEKNVGEESDDDEAVDVEEEEDKEDDKKAAETVPSSDEEDGQKEESMEEDEKPEEKKKAISPAKAKTGGSKDATITVTKDGKRRKRTRKLVPKQHIDEDGFMVTEKVWESDSTDASDEEEAPKAAKPVSPAAKTNAPKSAPQTKKNTTVSPSKNKQTSLMSFFKKK